jgi:hypothetical protein
MSAEGDFRALLAAHAPLVALVGQRGITQNIMAQGAPVPFVVFTSRHELTHDLLGEVVADAATLTAQCWGSTALQADQVADAVVTALAAAPLERAVAVVSRDTGFDEEVDLHATILTVEWWAL